MKICNYCSHANHHDQKYCALCRHRLPQPQPEKAPPETQSIDWLRKQAAIEDKSLVSVGGLAHKLEESVKPPRLPLNPARISG